MSLAPLLHTWVEQLAPIVPPSFTTLLWETLYFYPWASLMLVFVVSFFCQCLTRRLYVINALLSLLFAACTRLWLAHADAPRP